MESKELGAECEDESEIGNSLRKTIDEAGLEEEESEEGRNKPQGLEMDGRPAEALNQQMKPEGQRESATNRSRECSDQWL